MSETVIIEGRVEKLNAKSKLLGIKLDTGPQWYNKSKDEYLEGPWVPPVVGQAVRMMVTTEGNFAVACEPLAAFQPAYQPAPSQVPPMATGMYVPPAPTYVNPQEAVLNPVRMPLDATGVSIQRQVALKCATEIMVASITHGNVAPTPIAAAVDVAAMAATLWAAIEE